MTNHIKERAQVKSLNQHAYLFRNLFAIPAVKF